MTTLFKKLSITTLTLAIASGIVFSVGSSEPSTFEGEATVIGNYSIDLDVNDIFSIPENQSLLEFTTEKTPGEEVTFANQTDVLANQSGYLLRENNANDRILFGTKNGNHIKNIRTINAVFSNTITAKISFVYLKFTNGMQTDFFVTTQVNISSGENFPTETKTDGSVEYTYPYRFTLELIGENATLTSLSVGYDC